nr:asparaginase [Rhodococcus sp. HNM0569]
MVEVVRSGVRECVHRGSLVVLDAEQRPLVALGEVHTPIFPRSANKPWQAVAAMRIGFAPESAEEVALSTASHSGESDHLDVVRGILTRHGLDESALRCPPALPADELSRAELIAAGELPQPLYMECSGKHAAMLAACAVNGWPLGDYLDSAHPMQLAVADVFAALTGDADGEFAIDGCGLPIIPLSLSQLANSYRVLASAPADTPESAVVSSVREFPRLMSGTGTDDLALMTTVPGLFCKSGADGVHAGVFDDGTSFAFKIDDGHERARLPLVAAVAHRVLGESSEDLAALASRPVLGGGARVGTVRAIPGIL